MRFYGLHFYRLNQFVSPKSDFYQLLVQDAFVMVCSFIEAPRGSLLPSSLKIML